MSLDVLAYVPQTAAGASSRYRVFQMADRLAHCGVTLDIRPFLDARACARLYQPGRIGAKAYDLARGALRRWSDLAAAGRHRLALVHREVWPIIGDDLPLRRLGRQRPRWVFDLDDAVWMPNVSDVNRAFAWLKPFDQPARLASGARAIAAGNAYLADWARGLRPGGRPEDVEIIPTAVDTDRWRPRPREPGPPRLVWIGSPSTLRYLEALRPVLSTLAARHAGLEVHVIGARLSAEGLPVVAHEWSEHTEVELVRRCDIGLAPLPDTDWARGKCGLKLLLYMACGLPAVASRAGVHAEIVHDGRDGLLAATNASFLDAIERLLADPALRARMGAEARATAADRYSIHAVAPRLAALLQRAAENP